MDTSGQPVVRGAAGGPVAVVAHGTASSADFVGRLFAPALVAAGWRLVTWDRRGDGLADLTRLADEYGARLLGGVSYGAHIAARWAAAHPGRLEGLLVVLPGWIGRGGDSPAAGASRAGVEQLASTAVTDVLAAMEGEPWVVDEVRRAWPRWGADLADELVLTAASAGPEREELARLDVPVGLVALDGDALHPVEVAKAWHATLPRSALAVLPLAAPAADRGMVGRAALAALTRATRRADRP